MEKTLDWKNAEDYAYINSLDNKGLAWEFIRRSEAYRAAYNETQPVKKKFTWLFKAPKAIEEAKELTVSQNKAQTWGLFDMYDPNRKYVAGEIQFTLAKKYPLFFHLDGNVIDHEKTPPVPRLNPLDELNESYPANTLFVALTPGVYLEEQLNQVRSVFQAIGGVMDKPNNNYRPRPKKLENFIRFLDALKATPKESDVDIYKTITGDTSESGAEYGPKDMRKGALRYANESYQGFLFKIEHE